MSTKSTSTVEASALKHGDVVPVDQTGDGSGPALTIQRVVHRSYETTVHYTWLQEGVWHIGVAHYTPDTRITIAR